MKTKDKIEYKQLSDGTWKATYKNEYFGGRIVTAPTREEAERRIRAGLRQQINVRRYRGPWYTSPDEIKINQS